jgi:hypothetical protein
MGHHSALGGVWLWGLVGSLVGAVVVVSCAEAGLGEVGGRAWGDWVSESGWGGLQLVASPPGVLRVGCRSDNGAIEGPLYLWALVRLVLLGKRLVGRAWQSGLDQLGRDK